MLAMHLQVFNCTTHSNSPPRTGSRQIPAKIKVPIQVLRETYKISALLCMAVVVKMVLEICDGFFGNKFTPIGLRMTSVLRFNDFGKSLITN